MGIETARAIQTDVGLLAPLFTSQKILGKTVALEVTLVFASTINDPEITVEGNVKFNLHRAVSHQARCSLEPLQTEKPQLVVKNADNVVFQYSRNQSLCLRHVQQTQAYVGMVLHATAIILLECNVCATCSLA